MLFHIRHHFVDTKLNKFIFSALPVRKHNMCRHKGGNNIHRMIFIEFLEHFKKFHFCLEVNSVATLGFAGGNSKGHHFVKEPFRLIIQLLEACFSCFLYGIIYAAARSQDVKVARAFEFQRNLVLPVSAEHQMGMSFNKSRCYEVSLCVKHHIDLFFRAGKLSVRCDCLNNAIFCENRRIF